MPFTASHAVVALPFVRTRLPIAALAIGAMTPDAPLFFRLGIDYWVTHSVPGMLVVGVPLALVFLVLWRVLVRPALPELSPAWVRSRLPADWRLGAAASWWHLWGGRSANPGGRVRAGAIVVACLAFGILTHVFWDSFTHQGRWGSDILPALAGEWGPLPGYKWAQYSSSAVGLAIIIVFITRWLIRADAAPFRPAGPAWPRLLTWLSVPACVVAAALVVASSYGGPDAHGLVAFLSRTGTLSGAGIMVCVVVAAVITVLFGRGAGRADDPPSPVTSP